MSTASDRSPWVIVPPPPLFVLSFVLGAQLGRLLTLHVPDDWAPFTHAIGIAIVAGGAALLLPAPLMFLWRRTTLVPHRAARSLVTTGPYRVTRNPMYVALTALYVGASLALDQLVALPFLAFPLWVLATKTIPFEEATMERAFGDEFRAYCTRVRRWL